LEDKPYNLNKGSVDPQSAFSMTAITQGISLRLSLNGHEVGLAPEGTFTDTDSISLFVTPLPSGTSTANFQNFSFIELT
jgi:hypothetical protein